MPEYFGGTPTEGYDKMGFAEAFGVDDTPIFKLFKGSGKKLAEVLAPVGSGLGQAFSTVDSAMSFTPGVGTLETTARVNTTNLSDEAKTRVVQEQQQRSLEAQTGKNPYGMGPGLLAAGVGAAYGGWTYGVERPASTGLLVTDPDNPYPLKSRVRDSWNRTDKISFGDALQENKLAQGVPQRVYGAVTNIDQYDAYSDVSIESARRNPYYSFITGTTDAAFEILAPTQAIKPIRLAAMRSIGLQRTIDSPKRLDTYLDEYVKGRDGIKSTGSWEQVKRITEETNANRIDKEPVVWQSVGVDRSRLVQQLTDSTDYDTTYAILAGLQGDVRAIRALTEAAPDRVWALANPTADIVEDSMNGIPFRPTGEPLIKVQQTFDSAVDRNAFFENAKSLLVDAKGNPSAGGSMLLPGKRLVERVRGAAGDMQYKWDYAAFDGNGWVSQVANSKYIGGPVTHFVHWAGSRRPMGRVSVSEVRPNDWVIEFDGMMNSVGLFRGNKEIMVDIATDGTPVMMRARDYYAQQRDRLRVASTNRNMKAEWRAVEADNMFVMGLNLSRGNVNVANQFVDQLSKITDVDVDAVNYIDTARGVVFSETGDRILYSPQTISMLMDSFDSVRLGEVYDYMKSKFGTDLGKAGGKIEYRVIDRGVVQAFDALQSIFRTNVLLRLGYIPKNSIGEPWLASLIAHGTILTEEGLVDSLGNFAKNRGQQAARWRYRADVLNRINPKGRTKKRIRREIEDELITRSQAQRALERAEADLEAIRIGAVPPSRASLIDREARELMVRAAKVINSVESKLDETAPEWRQVVEPTNQAKVQERILELGAIVGDDMEYVDSLLAQEAAILRDAGSRATGPLRTYDNELYEITEEIHELHRRLMDEEGYLDDVSVAANKSDYTTVTYRDGSTVTFRGDRRGYFENHTIPDADYRGFHHAPLREVGASMDDPHMMFPDLGDPKFDNIYGAYSQELAGLFRKINGDPDALVTVYRAVPRSRSIQAGDWVTPFKSYAEYHANSNLADIGWEIKSRQVRANDLFSEGNSPAEWGWDPKYADDVVEVKYAAPEDFDSSKFFFAESRDLRAISMRRQLEAAKRKVDALKEGREKLHARGIENLRDEQLKPMERMRLEQIRESLDRVYRFQPEEVRTRQLEVLPAATPSVNDVIPGWNPQDAPEFFNLKERAARVVYPGEASMGDSRWSAFALLGEDFATESSQDVLRDLWNTGDSFYVRDFDEALQIQRSGIEAYELDEMVDVLDDIEERYLREGVIDEAQAKREIRRVETEMYERLDGTADDQLRNYLSEHRNYDIGSLRDKLKRASDQLGAVERLANDLETTLDTPADISEAVRMFQYEVGQESLARQGYDAGDMISVWRTGDDGSNQGVVAVTTKEGGLDSFDGELIEYKVRRDRVLFDAMATRASVGKLDGAELTKAEQELGIHFNDLVPVREYKPQTRQYVREETPEGWIDVHNDANRYSYAVVTDASQAGPRNVVRMEAAPTDSPVGGIKITDGEAPNGQGFMMLESQDAANLTRDLRLYGSAKFEESAADVMELLRVGDEYADDMLIEDAMRASAIKIDEVMDGNAELGEWIDAYFNAYWDLRYRKTGVFEPDVRNGYTSPDSQWWDLDPTEIKMMNTAWDVSKQNDNMIWGREIPRVLNSKYQGKKATGYRAKVYWSDGDLAVGRGVSPKSESPTLTSLRADLAVLRDISEREVMSYNNSPTYAGDNIKAAQEIMDESDVRLRELTAEYGAKQARIDRTKVFHGTGTGTHEVRVGNKRLTVRGWLSDDPKADSGKYRSEASADITAQMTYDPTFGGTASMKRMEASSAVEAIDRYDVRYWDEHTNVINAHFRKDKLVNRILQGDSKAEVVKWLRSEEGLRHQKSMGKDYLGLRQEGTEVKALNSDRNVYVLIEEARDIDDLFDLVYAYVPNEQVRKIIANRETDIGPGEMMSMLGGEEKLSRVVSARQDWNNQSTIQEGINKVLDPLWQFAQGMPETRLSRWPFFTREANRQLEQRANLLAAQGVDIVDLDDFKGLRKSSARAALSELEKTFYNIRRYNQGVYSARFLTSFPGAFFNSLYRYGRFGYKEPERMLTGALMTENVLDYLAVDADGNPVEDVADSVYIVVPGTQDEGNPEGARFPLQSLATLVIDSPGLSYLVSASTALWMQDNPLNDAKLRNASKWIEEKFGPDLYGEYFPFGPPGNVLETMAGAWQKDMWRGIKSDGDNLIPGGGDTDYLKTVIYFYQFAMSEWERNGEQGEPPSIDEAKRDAKAFYVPVFADWNIDALGINLTIPMINPVEAVKSRTFLKFSAPVTVSKREPGTLMRENWYEFKQQYPQDTPLARVEFKKKYGDHAEWYTYSASEYTAYLPSSDDVYKTVFVDNKALVEDLVGIAGNADLIEYMSLLALGADETYSAAVNDAYKREALPGDDVPISKRMDPRQFKARVEAAQGWETWTEKKTIHDAEVERLRFLRDNAKTQTERKAYSQAVKDKQATWRQWWNSPDSVLGGNEAWYAAKSKVSPAKRNIAARVLTRMISDDGFMEQRGKTTFWTTVSDFVETENRAFNQYNGMTDNDQKRLFRQEFRDWFNANIVIAAPELSGLWDRFYAGQWDPNDESTETEYAPEVEEAQNGSTG